MPDKNNTTEQTQLNNPLHGVKLADMLQYLVEKNGWRQLGKKINIRCFSSDPSIKSSLKFLRQTPWARDKVERLYLQSIRRHTLPDTQPPAGDGL